MYVSQAHEDRNLARKLTPAEKKEKKLKKLVGEANEGDAPQVALYKIMDLTNRQHQFKVKMNAQVSHLFCSQFMPTTKGHQQLPGCVEHQSQCTDC